MPQESGCNHDGLCTARSLLNPSGTSGFCPSTVNAFSHFERPRRMDSIQHSLSSFCRVIKWDTDGGVDLTSFSTSISLGLA